LVNKSEAPLVVPTPPLVTHQEETNNIHEDNDVVGDDHGDGTDLEANNATTTTTTTTNNEDDGEKIEQAYDSNIRTPHKDADNNTNKIETHNEKALSDDGDEVATQPETPEKDEFVDDHDDEQEEEENNAAVHNDEEEQRMLTSNSDRQRPQRKKSTKKKPNGNDRPRRFRCVLCVGCTLSIFLLGCIAILGYTLYSIRNDQEPSFFGFDISSLWKSDDVEKTSSSPTDLVDSTRNVLLESAASISGGLSMETVLFDESSLQYKVLEWLVKDPQIQQNSNSKIVQRFALGCFYWTLENINTQKHILDTWMTYADECTSWKTTYDEGKKTEFGLCNDNGEVISIQLQSSGLSGTIVPELALLSNSLGTCNTQETWW
jgi:hypothetical protein